MKNTKQQTAVEWLAEQMMHPSIHNPYIEQAKEMEKQMVIDAYKKGHEDGYHFEGSVSDYEAEGHEKHLAEQYYNETYGHK
jgi:hypothetical protein